MEKMLTAAIEKMLEISEEEMAKGNDAKELLDVINELLTIAIEEVKLHEGNPRLKISKLAIEQIDSDYVADRLKEGLLKPYHLPLCCHDVEPGTIARINQHISAELKEKLNEKKEENEMYYDTKEMAIKKLVEDFMEDKNLSRLDRDFVAFNNATNAGKIHSKYRRAIDKFDDKISDDKFFKKIMQRAKMSDTLSLRLSVLSRLGYVNIDKFLDQYRNFFDACKAAKELERLVYVSYKLSTDKTLNEIIDWAKIRPSEEYQNKFWREHYKKMLEYADAYDKEEVIWGISNTPEIKTEAMRRIIQTLTKTASSDNLKYHRLFSGQDFDCDAM